MQETFQIDLNNLITVKITQKYFPEFNIDSKFDVEKRLIFVIW